MNACSPDIRPNRFRPLYELRWRLFPFLRILYHVGPHTRISLRAIVRDPRHIQLSTGVQIGYGAELWTFGRHPDGTQFSIICDEDADIRSYSLLHAYGGHIKIGRGSCVNHFCFINGAGGVDIGNHVMIGTHTAILSSEHGYSSLNAPMALQPSVFSPVRIENDVYIGAGCTILAGVHIHAGAIIGAGSVVKKDVQEYEIAAGVPARRIGMRKK
jgi:acetyltransferase-like isoleucine patch superfamily enzyme